MDWLLLLFLIALPIYAAPIRGNAPDRKSFNVEYFKTTLVVEVYKVGVDKGISVDEIEQAISGHKLFYWTSILSQSVNFWPSFPDSYSRAKDRVKELFDLTMKKSGCTKAMKELVSAYIQIQADFVISLFTQSEPDIGAYISNWNAFIRKRKLSMTVEELGGEQIKLIKFIKSEDFRPYLISLEALSQELALCFIIDLISSAIIFVFITVILITAVRILPRICRLLNRSKIMGHVEKEKIQL